VNRYLTAFRIPATYPRPITLQDLMDHTAGFEDRTIGVGARSKDDVPPVHREPAAARLSHPQRPTVRAPLGPGAPPALSFPHRA
jgi:CubicO group peptidase (beta-lactamase class C family)